MENRSHEVLAVATGFMALSYIFVFLRIYVRAVLLKTFGLDDWVMVATQLSFTVYLACQLGGVNYGTGRHVEDIDYNDAVKARRFWYFCEIFYIVTTVLLKITIGVFLHRIALHKIHLWIIRAVMISTTIFGLMYLFIIIFQCTPIHIFWTVNPGGPGCLNTIIVVNTSYTAGALNAVADWTFGVLPFFIVWDLKMTKKAKGLVAAILAFAAVGSTATVVRIPYIKGLGETEDFLWSSIGVAIFSTIELGIGITAACIATLRPLMRNFLWRFGIGSVPASGKMSYGRQSRRTPSRGLNDIMLKEGVHTTIMSNNAPGRHGQGRHKCTRSSDEVEVLGKNEISRQVVVEIDESRPAPSSRQGLRKEDEEGLIEDVEARGRYVFGN